MILPLNKEEMFILINNCLYREYKMKDVEVSNSFLMIDFNKINDKI